MSHLKRTPHIIKNFIVNPIKEDGTLTACTKLYTNEIDICSGDTLNILTKLNISGDTILNGDLTPSNDNQKSIGSPVKRFREFNSYSGNTVIMKSTQKIETPNLDLGYDSNNESRIITAENSIIKNDTLFGGVY